MQETRARPWVRKSRWSRKWQSTPIFLPGKFQGQGSLAGYNPRGCKESNREHARKKKKKKRERERERKVGRRHSPEPKGGQSWQPRPQALPTRLQQQICLVMLRRMGREQPPSRSTRKHGPLASEITCWAGEVGEEILQGRVSSGVD